MQLSSLKRLKFTRKYVKNYDCKKKHKHAIKQLILFLGMSSGLIWMKRTCENRPVFVCTGLELALESFLGKYEGKPH